MEINLIELVVGLVVCLIIFYIINMFPLQEPFKKIVLLLYGLVVFLWLLGALGIINGMHIGIHS